MSGLKIKLIQRFFFCFENNNKQQKSLKTLDININLKKTNKTLKTIRNNEKQSKTIKTG